MTETSPSHITRRRGSVGPAYAFLFSLLGVFIIQLVLLPSRYYIGLWNICWPWTHNIPLLAALALAFYVADKFRGLQHSAGSLLLISAAIGVNGLVAGFSSVVNASSGVRETTDYLTYYIATYGPILAIFVGYYASGTKASTRTIVGVVVAACVAFGLASWLFTVSDNVFGLVLSPADRKNYFYRLRISRLSPTSLGLVCSVVLPMALGLWVETRRRLALFAVGVIAITLVFTLSRWNLIVGFCAVGGVVYRERRSLRSVVARYKGRVIGLALLVCIGLSGFVASEWLGILIGSESSRFDRTSSGDLRLQSLVRGWALFLDKPFIGYGAGEVYVRLLNNPRDEFDYGGTDFINYYDIPLEMPHSIVIEVMVEQGVLGIFSYLLVTAAIVKICLRCLLRSNSPAARATASSMLGFWITGLFANFDNIMETWVLFWLVLGIVSRAAETRTLLLNDKTRRR